MNIPTLIKRVCFTLVLLFPISAMSGTNCNQEDASKVQQIAKKLAASFPVISYQLARRGKFSTTNNPDTGTVVFTFASSRGKKLFERSAKLEELDPDTTLPGCGMQSKPRKGKPANRLVTTFECGPEKISFGCAMEIQPGINRRGKSGWTYRVMNNPVSR